MAKKENIVVGLDIGTTKTCVIVGEITNAGIDIIGIGSHLSSGLRKGIVVNIDSTVDSIKRAVEEAELMSGCEIRSVFTGIAGSHIRGLNSYGIVAVKGGEVDEYDVKRALEAAKAVAIPLDRKIIHILPQYYIVDDQDGVKEPIGMSGVRLEAKVHVVTGAITSIQNIIKSVNRVGLDVNDIVLEPPGLQRDNSQSRRKGTGGCTDRYRWRYYRHSGVCRGKHSAYRCSAYGG